MKENILKKEEGWLLKEKYPRLYRKLLYEKIRELPPEVEKDIKKLEQGEPVDYVIGFSKFLGCKIDLSLKPLIPRPETEYWTEKAIEEIRRLSKKKKVKCLDIFSGSGCIGIAVLKKIKNSEVDFAEKEEKFLKQVKLNARLNQIAVKRYRIIRSDVFKAIRGKYDYILANPPYIALKEKNKVQKAVLAFENRKAIFGGRDGLYYIRKFLEGARKYLKKEGKIYMEFGSGQKREIARLLHKYHYKNYFFFKDQYNRFRYLTAS